MWLKVWNDSLLIQPLGCQTNKIIICYIEAFGVDHVGNDNISIIFEW